MTINTSKTDTQAKFTALSTSLQALPDADSVILQGQTYKKAELVSTFQTCLAAMAKTKSARTDWLKAVAEEKAARAAARPLLSSVKSYLDARLGKANPAIATFGFKPAKPVQKKVKVKAAAVDKSLATRKARGTMGKKAKSQIKGAPPTTPPSPVATSAAPAAGPPAVQPAVAPTTTGGTAPHVG